MQIGFIGLGNVGSKLAGSLLSQGFLLRVHDLDAQAVSALVENGAQAAQSPAALAEQSDLIITCLPSPAATASVMEGEHGILSAARPGTLWVEMSTTDAAEVRRLAEKLAAYGVLSADCPVSGGCHRAATGNISIFAGCERAVFDQIFPVLQAMGQRILHTGELGSASVLKVVTNFLATANLLSVCEALATCKAAQLDLATAYEGIRISSGNSFVHETEGQLILNGSRNVNFTMDLVLKDIGLFQAVAEQSGLDPLLNPLLVQIMSAGAERYGQREWSPNIIRQWEEAIGAQVLADGFPAELIDEEERRTGYEVKPPGSQSS